jgi:hypothetical protein
VGKLADAVLSEEVTLLRVRNFAMTMNSDRAGCCSQSALDLKVPTRFEPGPCYRLPFQIFVAFLCILRNRVIRSAITSEGKGMWGCACCNTPLPIFNMVQSGYKLLPLFRRFK